MFLSYIQLYTTEEFIQDGNRKGQGKKLQDYKEKLILTGVKIRRKKGSESSYERRLAKVIKINNEAIITLFFRWKKGTIHAID